ncbi:MAG: Rieske 2Fe-2S domain-containing protein, partial [Myxococcota bacterium]
MERSKELELINLSLGLAQEKRPPAPEPETMVPVANYLDPERFRNERERFHRPALNLVAHRSEIESPGDYLTVDVVGSPVILVRDPDGRARAFLNVCRHRGAKVTLEARGS